LKKSPLLYKNTGLHLYVHMDTKFPGEGGYAYKKLMLSYLVKARNRGRCAYLLTTESKYCAREAVISSCVL